MKNRTIVGLCALLCGIASGLHAQKIVLNTSMVTLETGTGNATALVDEQTTAGDPLNNNGGVPATQWDPGWNAPTYNAYVDLGVANTLTTISIFEGNGGTQNVVVSTGSPGAWTPLYTESLNTWHKWFNHPVTINTRYVRLTVPQGSSVAEVVLYGSAANVPVTGITINPSTASIGVGSSMQLTATIAPANATNPAVTWSSSNSAAATVNLAGGVTGVAPGSALITATTVDQGKSATAAVTVTGSGGTAKLALSTGMVTTESGDGNAGMLVDEQAAAGDPLANAGGTPTSQWDPGWSASTYNAYVDLGGVYDLSAISLFEGNGATHDVIVSTGSPGAWTPWYTESLNTWHKWFTRTATTTTRYVRFTVTSGSSLAEVALYGSVPNDVTPPAAITDLAAGNITSNSAVLSWTAPGNNGNVGTASAYDVRRSTSPLTSANFTAATVVTGAPAPAVAGTMQGITVTGLAPGTSYYFAIETSDAKPNVSGLSNVVVAATGAPDTTPPGAISNLSAGAVTSNSVVLNWTAPGDDGYAGTATVYDIRSSQSLITSANFAAATPVTGGPVPMAAGAAQTMPVTGLSAATTYYFALKSSDEVPNVSALSNVVSAQTSSGPARNAITFDQFMGTHAFVDDPVNLLQCVGFIREYHNWNWDEGDIWSGGGNLNYSRYPNNKMQFAPKYSGNWNFDTFYTAVKAAGVTIEPCIQGAAAWLQGGTNFPFNNKPVDTAGASTTVPNNYQAIAHHFFQFAARYGSTVVADSKLTLAADQPRNSGMNLVKYMEDWNEENKNWEGPDAQFSAQEYAAMLSADYDGHCRTMTGGTGTFGAKNADPAMKVVMGGLAENGDQAPQVFVTFINDMKTWFVANRADHKFAADVINVHHYGFAPGNISSPGPGLSPEADNFESRLKLVVDYRDQQLDPATEVWISEFGWDTNQGSPLRAPPIGPFDVQEVQAQWILRSYLAFAAVGVDRAIQFMMRDNNPNDPTWFSSCGLMGPKDDWTPKKSYFYVYTMKNVMSGTRFLGKVSTGNPSVYAYKFKNISGNSGVYVLWCPTSNNTTVNAYQLAVPGATNATKIALTPGSTTGTPSALAIGNGTVNVNVSEQPVFVKVDHIQ
ncbi:MAG: Ig-like domain-containing protein [Lacunisphaera sp.]